MVDLGANGAAVQGGNFEMGEALGRGTGATAMALDLDTAIDSGHVPIEQLTGGVIHDAETGTVHQVNTGVETAWDEGRLRHELMSRGRRVAQAMRRVHSGREIRVNRGDGPAIPAVSEADFSTMPPRVTRIRRDSTPQPVFEAAI